MVDLYFDRAEVTDYEQLLYSLPDTEFKNLTRSTIPLLDAWRDPKSAVEMLTPTVALDPSHTQAHFEFTVPSLGRARASATDVMVTSDGTAIGIEAKSTEPMYETVGEWLAGGAANRRRVLDHWCELIGCSPSTEIDRCVYQMVHRLASVCSLRASSTHLLYVQYSTDDRHAPDYERELDRLVSTFDLGGRVSVSLITVALRPTHALLVAQQTVAHAHPSERPELIRRALLSNPLYIHAERSITAVA